MLDVEAALARSQAALRIIPPAAAPTIAEQCCVDLYDVGAIEDAAGAAGNLAIPLVTALTQKVATVDRVASGYVHWGATSQDIIDTALILQLADAFALIEPQLAYICDALAAQADAHRTTVMAGRTWLQHASPVTLGAKLAMCLGALERDRARIAALRGRLLVIQFGGAVGNLAALGQRGPDAARGLAQELGLSMPETPWHTQRDRLCECAAGLGIMTATLGKLARDLSLLAQTEVGEANEPAAIGRGGSSTLPHKRNPIGCAIALASAIQVPGLVATMFAAAVQEHERGLGNWPAEWETLPRIVTLTEAALRAMTEVVVGLHVDAERMRKNVGLAQGELFAEAAQMALAPSLGRDVAHRLVAEIGEVAQREGRHMGDALAADERVAGVLDSAAIKRLFEAQHYLGATDAFIDAALASRGKTRSHDVTD